MNTMIDEEKLGFSFFRELMAVRPPTVTTVKTPLPKFGKEVRMTRTEWHKQKEFKVEHFIEYKPRAIQ